MPGTIAYARENTNAAGALARCLATSASLCHVVVSPGSRNTPLVLACAARHDMRLHVALDERAAGFAALGLARATGQAAVLICTSGSAAAHYLPALCEAALSRVPLIVISADRPPELHDSGAPQTMPQADLFGCHVGWQTQLPAPTTPQHARVWHTAGLRARLFAEQLRPGPVHINAPMHEPLWDPQIPIDAKPALTEAPWICGTRHVTETQLIPIVQQLNQASRGLIVCGTLASWIDAPALAEQVGALAAHLGWPVLADATSQLRFIKHTALAAHRIDVADLLLRTPQDFYQPQFVLRLGMLPTSKSLWRWLGTLGETTACTQVLLDAHGDWRDPNHVVQHQIIAPPTAILRQLRELTQHKPKSVWLQTWQAAQHQIRTTLAQAQAQDGCLWEGAIAEILLDHVREHSIVHLSSSMPIRDVEAFAYPKTQCTLHVSCNRGVNGIDGTIATIVGLAAADPQRPVVGLMGDLAFLHDIGALQLAKQWPISALLIVVDNQGGDIFSLLPVHQLRAQHLGQVGTTPFETYFRTPQNADIRALCQAAGAHYETVHDLENFRSACARLVQQPHTGFVVLHVRIDAAEARAQRQKRWQLATGSVANIATGIPPLDPTLSKEH